MKRVLVVDDDRVVADTLGLIFRQRGFACESTYSTDEALALARTFQPDLLLCDITMPDRDGMELMQEMRREHPECRVLVLTGYTYNAQRVIEESDAESHRVGVLTKPCQPAILLREAGAMLA